MWKCHKCGKPVYFAERKQSLGYDWHPECLRCEECGKRLNPGQHAEHKGIPYCHVPCYGALFGPQLYGHGTRVESHTSFGKVENKTVGRNMPRSHLESKLKLYNQFYEGKSGEIRCREVNGRLVLEGALRIYWGVCGVIHLKEDDDQRTVVTVRKRNSCRHSFFNGFTPEDRSEENNKEEKKREKTGSKSDEEAPAQDATSPNLAGKCLTLPSKLDIKNIEWDQLDQLLKVERSVDISEKLYQTLPTSLPSVCDASPTVDSADRLNDSNGPESPRVRERSFDRSQSNPEKLSEGGQSGASSGSDGEEVEGRRRAKRRGPTAIRRRPGGRRRQAAKLRRRCSINGHFYNRETSFFTPPRGSQASVWVTSLVSSSEVINLMLDKYKVDSDPNQFALFVIRDNGEQRMLKEEEYPLMVRVMLGPHEDVAKLYLVDRKTTDEISPEVAQFLNLTLVECNAILEKYRQEEQREERRVLTKYRELYRLIKIRMEDLRQRQ